jgi:hypothetical protein
MKNNLKKIALFAMGLSTLVSCKRIGDFGDTNVNPSAITTPATYAVLTGVLTGISGWAKDNAATIWIQYASETQYPGTGLYAIPTFGMGTYTGALLNLKTIIDANSNPDEVAVARILTQYIYWHLTDGLGDIPYSEALKGITPKYDKQQDIYKGMIAELTAAKNQIVNNGALKGDILNGNDANKWKKFANSLRAMMAIQLSKRYPGAAEYAATQFKAAIADGVIDNNADNIKLVYPGGTFKNPYFNDHDGARDNGESVQLFGMLAALGDGRQAAFGNSSTPVIYGVKEATINAWIKANINWSRILGDNQRLETSPVYMLTASQLFMARAEAAARGWTTEDKTSMLTQGINASFAQWGLALPSASYFTQALVVLDGTNDIKKIAEQTYLASFPNGRAGWNSWRRTGYPVLTPAPDPLNPAHVVTPRRYTFTPATGSTFSEYLLNPGGVASSTATLVPAGDLQENKIWWDQ